MISSSRHTKQRQLVLWIVKSAAAGLTAEQVFTRVQQLQPTIGQATVYRNLKLLGDRGEVVVVEGDDGIRQYFGHAFHEQTFRCQRCGRRSVLKHIDLAVWLQRAWPRQHVFASRLLVQGLCRDCQRQLKRSLA
ncbi:MAG: transcriptional repressor [Candidatus Kerfeldbacteria bacterium]|nr:transcriptional repressor [Candidatus Kerfeldbacteria bacterium]